MSTRPSDECIQQAGEVDARRRDIAHRFDEGLSGVVTSQSLLGSSTSITSTRFESKVEGETLLQRLSPGAASGPVSTTRPPFTSCRALVLISTCRTHVKPVRKYFRCLFTPR